MKKQIVVLSLISGLIVLTWCSTQKTQEVSQSSSSSTPSCNNQFVINPWSSSSLNLKSKVVAFNLKNVISNNWWNVEFLDCEKWAKVTEKTLIAKIKPDYSDPNIQNLLNQNNMINSQISNTNDIIASTKENFATQLNSLKNQKANLESQISILNDSFSKIGEQKDFGVMDIDKQLETLQIQLDTLQTQIEDLGKSKLKLEDSKLADIEKLNTNFVNTKTQAKSLAWNMLLQIDEIFWITDRNKNKNDEYESFLSAKNTALKESVKQDWSSLNERYARFDSFNNTEISTYLQSLNDLAAKTKDSIKSSAVASNFSQNTIDNYYNAFSQYESNIITSKNWLDNIIKSLDTVRNTYDNQILTLNTQINSAENSKKSVTANIENVKSNKLWTYNTSVDLQKNQTKAQIETTQTSLKNIQSQIDSLESQKQIQLNQLNNQLSQLQSSLKTININLDWQAIYAEVSWVVKEKVASLGNKVWSSALLCQILPNKAGLKLQVYSSFDLQLPLDIRFIYESKEYSTTLESKLPYQDTVTQNYIYETSDVLKLDWKQISLATILSEWKTIDVTTWTWNNVEVNDSIYVPISYVSNTINWSFVKTKDVNWQIIDKKVVLWELDSNNVLIREWLKLWDTICY